MLIITCLLFSFVGVALSVEIGHCLVAVQPKLTSKSTDNVLTNYSSWVILDTLLELLILGILTLVTYSYFVFNNSITWFLVISLLALFIKTSNMTFIHHRYKKPWLNKSYLLFSYITVISLGSLGVYLVTGKQFWQTSVGWTLIVTILLGVTVTGLSYINRTSALDKSIKLKQLLQLIFVFWLLFMGFVYPIVLQHYNSSLIGISLSIMEAVVIGGVIGYTISTIQQKKPHELYQYCFLISLLVTFLIGWNNRPYLILGRIPINQIFKLNAFHSSLSWLAWLVLLLMIFLLINAIYLVCSLLFKGHTKRLIHHLK